MTLKKERNARNYEYRNHNILFYFSEYLELARKIRQIKIYFIIVITLRAKV